MEAMLQLLNILVNHGSQLHDSLKMGLAEASTAPWGEISPQLFAQVRASLQSLVILFLLILLQP